MAAQHYHLEKIPCPRCDGKGWIPRYWYNRKGICFRCWGAKYIYVKVPDGMSKEEVIAQEKAKEQAHLDAHPPKHPLPENLKNPLYDDPKERAAFKGKRRGLEDILQETAAQEGKAEKAIKALSRPIEPKTAQNPELEALVRPTREQAQNLESKDPMSELEALRKQHEELKKRLAELEAERKKQMEQGNISTVRTERGTKVKTRFKVVEANDLITSHDDNGNVNPLFPKELQPRDRSRATSEAQVEHISNTLDPELLADSKKASDGAPIIGSDNVVESGNGRTMAIRRAYLKDNQAAKDYKKYLLENAEEFGLDPEQIKNMKNPVLVRERISNVDRTQFTREANESGVSALSMGEQAKVDAEKLNSFVLDQYEGGDFRKEENAPFVQAFFANVVSQADAGRFWTQSKDGGVQLSDEGALRLRNALFAKAYSDPQLINLLAEARDDSSVKYPLEALVDTAGDYAKLRQKMDDGDLYKMDISKELTGAIRTADHLRREGRKVDVYLSQQNLFGEDLSPEEKLLLRFLDHNKRRKQAIMDFVHNYIHEVESEGRPDQMSLFGEAEPPNKTDLLKRAIAKTDGGDDVIKQFEEKDAPAQEEPKPEPKKSDAENGPNKAVKPEGDTQGIGDTQNITLQNNKPAQEEPAQPKAEEPKQETGAVQVNTFDDMVAMKRKIREGKATAAEIKAHARAAVENKDAIIQDIYERVSNDPRFKRRQKKTKMQIAQNTFQGHLQDLAYAGSDAIAIQMFNGKSWEDNMLENINKLTDEKIQAKFAKRQAEKAAAEKALTNPETLDELRKKQIRVGLTPEEEDRMASLIRQQREEMDRKAQEEKAAKKAEARQVASSDRFTIEEDTHTKTGEKLWVAKLKDKVDREEYKKIADEMRALGGYYSRYKKGFIFKEDPTEKLNGQAVSPDVSQGEQDLNAQEARKTEKRVSSLRDQADALQNKINDIRNKDRLTNTARRAAMAASALREADRLERQQKIMRSVADAIENGQADHLKELSTRTQVETLIREAESLKFDKDKEKGLLYQEKYKDRPLTKEDIDGAKMPVYGTNRGWIEELVKDTKNLPGAKLAAARVEKELTRQKRLNPDNYTPDMSAVRDDLEKLIKIGKEDKNASWWAKSVADGLMRRKRLEAMGIDNDVLYRAAMREFMDHYNGTAKSEEEKRKEALKLRQAEVAMSKIPGYFPTPKNVVNRMVEEADIKPGMNVLEPSAGSGHIADLAKEAGANVDTVEINHTLRGILQDKGHNLVGSDFMQFNEKNKYDRILMNPPFEKGQDIDHVMHAYDLLKPGGKLVAIMSEGAFFRSDKKAKQFQEFMKHVDGHSEKLPEGTFKQSDRQTGVNTRLVVINKPENPAESPEVKMIQTQLDDAEKRLEKARNTPSLKPFVPQIEKEVERLRKRLAKLNKAS